jgi:hypothetical protein
LRAVVDDLLSPIEAGCSNVRGIDDWEQRLDTAMVKASPTDRVKPIADDATGLDRARAGARAHSPQARHPMRACHAATIRATAAARRAHIDGGMRS